MQTIQAVIPKPGDVAVSAAGADVSISYPAVPGKRHVIFLINASYSATPTGGNLHIHRGDAGGVVCLDLDIADTKLEVGYHMPISCEVGEAMTITLAGGGGAIIGKISVEHYVAPN